MSYTAPSVAASGISFATWQSDGASGHLEALITANLSATAAPTSAPTLSQTGSGTTLPAATYYVVVTESNGFGETTASPASTGQAITLGQNLVVTFPSLKTGNVSRNTYVGTASGGPFTLAASGTTASTVTISAPLPTNSYAVNPPTVNTTGLTYTDANSMVHNRRLEMLRAAKDGNLELVYQFFRQVVYDFNHGNPMLVQRRREPVPRRARRVRDLEHHVLRGRHASGRQRRHAGQHDKHDRQRRRQEDLALRIEAVTVCVDGGVNWTGRRTPEFSIEGGPYRR